MIHAGAATLAEVVDAMREVDAVLRPERQPAIATLVRIGSAES
jgi:hypothetical protein